MPSTITVNIPLPIQTGDAGGVRTLRGHRWAPALGITGGASPSSLQNCPVRLFSDPIPLLSLKKPCSVPSPPGRVPREWSLQLLPRLPPRPRARARGLARSQSPFRGVPGASKLFSRDLWTHAWGADPRSRAPVPTRPCVPTQGPDGSRLFRVVRLQRGDGWVTCPRVSLFYSKFLPQLAVPVTPQR